MIIEIQKWPSGGHFKSLYKTFSDIDKFYYPVQESKQGNDQNHCNLSLSKNLISFGLKVFRPKRNKQTKSTGWNVPNPYFRALQNYLSVSKDSIGFSQIIYGEG